MTLDELLRVPYERNARGPQALDCWGQVRLARLHLFGRPLLPAFCEVASEAARPWLLMHRHCPWPLEPLS